MFVLSPQGAIARVASVPRSQDASQLVINGGSAAGLDAVGRLVYRSGMRLPTLNATGMTTAASADSGEILRLDLKTRRLDTAGYLKIFKVAITATQTEKGLSLAGVVNPIQMVDEWTLLSDGSVAIVRGLDYRVDFIGADGRLVRGRKIPFQWQPLSDEGKAAILDSVRGVFLAPAPAGSTPGPPAMSTHSMSAMHGGMAIDMKLAPESDLPDYSPAFEQNAARGDADGNLWIRTTAARDGAIGGPIFDVIARSGALIDRIQIPTGRRIVGFGRGGVVYLAASDASGAWIERTRRPT